MDENEIQACLIFILSNIHKYRNIQDKAYKVKKHLVHFVLSHKLKEQDFYKITSVLSPQSRSPLWQNCYMEKHGCERVQAKEDKGDFIKDGKYYEYKGSGFSQDGNLNVVQIRPWQECHYIVQFISYSDVHTFELTHDEMLQEMKLCNASSAHGTGKAIIDNRNIEYRMTIEKDGKDWIRWLKLYR